MRYVLRRRFKDGSIKQLELPSLNIGDELWIHNYSVGMILEVVSRQYSNNPDVCFVQKIVCERNVLSVKDIYTSSAVDSVLRTEPHNLSVDQMLTHSHVQLRQYAAQQFPQ